jgi:DNA helicase-2/ATP-dependent DNA helicase PcrA
LRIDPKRLSRKLFTNNPDGCGISVLKAKSEIHEAELVTKEIGRILEFSNGLVKFKDIAILFRMTALTFNFERALGQANIPFVVVSKRHREYCTFFAFTHPLLTR